MDKHKEDHGKTAPRLEIVLKCDSAGSIEAVTTAILAMGPEPEISVVHSGLGAVSKSDILLAETSSGLIIGFQVALQPEIERTVREHNVEVRLYDVIYTLTDDIKAIAESMVPAESGEDVVGSAKVIALFKSSRRGIIIGCEISKGFLSQGQHFRVISAMGPVYTGIIESIHIGDKAVQKVTPGQQAGIKIRDFNKARIGDLVESFRPLHQKVQRWHASGKIIRK
jgi:translation initiation factor IF-2